MKSRERKGKKGRKKIKQHKTEKLPFPCWLCNLGEDASAGHNGAQQLRSAVQHGGDVLLHAVLWKLSLHFWGKKEKNNERSLRVCAPVWKKRKKINKPFFLQHPTSRFFFWVPLGRAGAQEMTCAGLFHTKTVSCAERAH